MGERAQQPTGSASVISASDALRDVAGLGGFFALPTTADAGALSFPDGFAARAREVNRRYATNEARVGWSIAHLGLAARLWSPVLACTVIHGIVLDLSGGLEWADGTSGIRLRGPAAGRPVGQLPDVGRAVYEQVSGPLAALEDTFEVKVAMRLLDGNVASALVGSAAVLLRARPEVRPALMPLTHALLTTGRLSGTGDVTGPDLTFRRRSCCLFYRAPGGGKCGDCCLLDD
ncbi:(2Fe-2S)-binding protein [Streptomyces sp. NPDC046939]|uniref:(2Fe-2S)-binding protein n=1 Tax=Streptomyces sp. NPDC046939 TaxID=3155376 RepID=UPI0033D5A59A